MLLRLRLHLHLSPDSRAAPDGRNNIGRNGKHRGPRPASSNSPRIFAEWQFLKSLPAELSSGARFRAYNARYPRSGTNRSSYNDRRYSRQTLEYVWDTKYLLGATDITLTIYPAFIVPRALSNPDRTVTRSNQLERQGDSVSRELHFRIHQALTTAPMVLRIFDCFSSWEIRARVHVERVINIVNYHTERNYSIKN